MLSPYQYYLYRKLGVSLWEVCQITGLPIVGEVYDEFFSTNKIIWTKPNVPPKAIPYLGGPTH